MDAENTYQVFDWLWTSGQLSERDIASMPLLGIQVVVNIAYVQIPVEWNNPQPEQFAQFVGVLNIFAGRKVWVHCAKNMRVSAFIYLYRKLMLGETENEASFPMDKIWSPNQRWQAFIEQVSVLHGKDLLGGRILTPHG